MSGMIGWRSLALFALIYLPLCSGKVYVTLQNDGPTVYGSPIMFSAQLIVHDEPIPNQLLYKFLDNSDPKHTFDSGITSETNMTFMFTAQDIQDVGYHTMSVRVYRVDPDGSQHLLGERFSAYDITVNLNGEIVISQPGVVHRDIDHVSTRHVTLLEMKLHDPHGYLNRSSRIDYFWSMNNILNTGPYNQSVLRYNFTKTGSNRVRCAVMVHKNPNLRIATPSNMASANLRIATPGPINNMSRLAEPVESRIDEYKWGMFNKDFIVDEPVTFVRVTGDSWLRNGAMLHLTMQCNGTGPWNYCVHIEPGHYNVTGNETCDNGPVLYEACGVSYTRYLPKNSSYTAVFVVTNAVSRRVATVSISVNVDDVPQLSYYIVPLSCALLAFVFILFGSIQMVKSRRDYNVEIADFDIEPTPTSRVDRLSLLLDDHDGCDGELTFWRRVWLTLRPRCFREGWPRGSGNRTASEVSEGDPILAPGRSHRLSYGIIETYDDHN